MNAPIATVAAILTNGDRVDPRVLLTRRACDPDKGLWCLPGGSISQSESARDAVIREVKEETAVSFEPTFFQCFDEIIPEKGHHHVLLVFEGSAIGVPTDESDEVDEVRWFNISEALNLDLAFRNVDVLKAYASRLSVGAFQGGLLAEYSGLRGEITRRISIRWQIEAFTMMFSAGFLALAMNNKISQLVLILVPCFVALLATIWAHNNLRIGELGTFLRQEIEPKCPGLRWEHRLVEAFDTESKRFIRIRVSLYAYFLFLLSALFIPLATVFEGGLSPSVFSHVVLVVNIGLAVVVFFLVRFGRRLHERPEQKRKGAAP